MQFFFRYSAFVLVLAFIQITLCAQSLSSYGGSAIESSSEKAVVGTSFAGSWEAGAMLGPDFYYGDLNVKKFLPSRSVSFAGGVYITRQFTNVIGVKGELLVGGLNGNRDYPDNTSPYTVSFKGAFFDFSVHGVLNISNLLSPYHEGRKLFVYASLGLGIDVWNSHRSVTINGESFLVDTNTATRAALVIPVCLGLQYAITSRISAGVEYTVRPVFSDFVDQTQGGFKSDFVNLLSFTASYRFGSSKKKLNVQEYPYTTPVSYQPQPKAPEPIPAPVKPRIEIPSASEVYDYVVQICAYSKHDYTVEWVKKHYHVDLPVIKESENGLNRYIIGQYYKDINVAKELCDRFRKDGIHDAWVIAYQHGVRHHVVVY